MFSFCGGENIAAKHLKSISDWIEPEGAQKLKFNADTDDSKGYDTFGFNAKPMGTIQKTKLFAEFFGFGNIACFWSADTHLFYNGWASIAFMHYFSSQVIIDTIEKRLGVSIRCIKI